MAFTYSKIGEVIVGSGGTSSINFSSIPSIYTDLKLVFSLGNTGGSGTNEVVQIRFNGVSSGIYNYKIVRGSGTGSGSFDIGIWGNTFIMANYAPGAANCFTNGEAYIPNYTSSTNKSVSVDAVYDIDNATSYSSLVTGMWPVATAITSITLNYAANNIIQNSIATLYGIRATEY